MKTLWRQMISYLQGISPEVIANTLRSFEGVEHRLEFVGEVDGIALLMIQKELTQMHL